MCAQEKTRRLEVRNSKIVYDVSLFLYPSILLFIVSYSLISASSAVKLAFKREYKLGF